MDVFDLFAFIVFAVLLAAAVIIVVILGQLPGQIAARRGHPQAAAINAASWLGVATLGLLWPLAFIWAFLVPSPARAAGSAEGQRLPLSPDLDPKGDLAQMRARVEALETALRDLRSEKGVTP